MMMRFSRSEILERLNRTIKEGVPILGAGASAGIVAKCAEKAGADLVIVYSSGRFRLMGLPSSRFGDSNAATLEMATEIMNVVDNSPVIAGVDATDPTRLDLRRLLQRFVDAGYSGIINFPTISIFESYRELRESVGLGFSRELEMFRVARDMDLFTMAYAYNPQDARSLAEVGIDCMVAHAGGTVGGLVGYRKARTKEEAAPLINEIIAATKEIDPNVICIAHGGPYATPDDTEHLYANTTALGFVGASSIERIPIEEAILGVVKGFKGKRIR